MRSVGLWNGSGFQRPQQALRTALPGSDLELAPRGLWVWWLKVQVFSKLSSEGNWSLEPRRLPAAVGRSQLVGHTQAIDGNPVGGRVTSIPSSGQGSLSLPSLPAPALRSCSCSPYAFPSPLRASPAIALPGILFLPFPLGGFCCFLKPLLAEALLFQEALLAAPCLPQAGWPEPLPCPPPGSLLVSSIWH